MVKGSLPVKQALCQRTTVAQEEHKGGWAQPETPLPCATARLLQALRLGLNAMSDHPNLTVK